MFKLKFGDTKSREFLQAYSKVMTFTGYKDMKVAYNIAKIGRKYDSEAKICQELWLKLLKNYAKLDDKGNIAPRMQESINAKGEKVSTKVPNTYEILPEKVEDGSWEKATIDFDATEFEIPCHKIKLADLAEAKLAPMDLMVLEPMIDDTEPVAAVAPIKPAAAPAPKA